MDYKKKYRYLAVLFLFLWILFTLYPQPLNLGKSIYRLFNPPVNPSAEGICSVLERTTSTCPREIEEVILTMLPYQYDWQTYNMPWYFPTVEEVLSIKTGDCKSRLIVLSSVLEAKQKNYQINASLTHIWVDYYEKEKTTSENEEVVLFSSSEEGFFIKVPQINWKKSLNLFWEAFWRKMPPDKKITLLSGIFFFSFFALFPCRVVKKV